MDLQTEKIIAKICEWKCDWRAKKAANLNPHQQEYFSAWLERVASNAVDQCRTNQQLKEMIEVLDRRAQEEMDVVACLSDVAIEMRWLRVLPPPSSGVF